MNTQPTSQALTRTLIAVHDWQREAKIRNMGFYLGALANNEITVTPGKEFTTRKGNCDICRMPQAPGIRKFHYTENHETGYQSFDFHLCDQCFAELIASVTLHDFLFLSQQIQTVTS